MLNWTLMIRYHLFVLSCACYTNKCFIVVKSSMEGVSVINENNLGQPPTQGIFLS